MDDLTITKEQAKHIAKVVVAGGFGAAAAASLLGAIKANRDKRKVMDVKDGKGTIIVPISKGEFVRGLPTPEAFREQYEEKHRPRNEVPAIGQGSQEDIDMAKKIILASAGKKFNYFKAAQDSSEEARVDEGTDNEKSDGEDVKLDMRKSRSGEGVKTPGDELPRDELGRFVSLSDTEKKADGFLNNFIGWPAGVVASSVGIMWLAEKLANKVSELRIEKAENELTEARKQYVKNLETMKTAEDEYGPKGWLDWGTALAGASFILPTAFAAMIANRVMEKRYEDKKKAMEESGGLPPPTTVLYTTVDNEKVAVSPETIAATVLTKAAMYNEFFPLSPTGMDKCAEVKLMSPSTWKLDPRTWGNPLYDFSDTFDNGEATDATWDYIDKNKNKMLEYFVSGSKSVTPKQQRNADKELEYGLSNMNKKKLNREQLATFLNSNKFQDYIVKNFETDPEWRSHRDKMVNDRIIRRFGDNWFGRFIQWLSNLTGIGGGLFNSRVRGGIGELAKKVYKPSNTAPGGVKAVEEIKHPDYPKKPAAPAPINGVPGDVVAAGGVPGATTPAATETPKGESAASRLIKAVPLQVRLR